MQFSKVGSESIPIPKSEKNRFSPRSKDRLKVPNNSPFSSDFFLEAIQSNPSPGRQLNDSQNSPRVNFLDSSPEHTITNLKDSTDKIAEKSTSIFPASSNNSNEKSGNISKEALSKSDSDTRIISTEKQTKEFSDTVNKRRSRSANERKSSSINPLKIEESDDLQKASRKSVSEELKGVSRFRNHDQLRLNLTNIEKKCADDSSSDSSTGREEKTLSKTLRQSLSSLTSFTSSSPISTSPTSSSSSSSSSKTLPSPKKSPKSNRSSGSPHRNSPTPGKVSPVRRRISVEDRRYKTQNPDYKTRCPEYPSLVYLKHGKANQNRDSGQKDSLHKTHKQALSQEAKENYLLPQMFIAEHNTCIKKLMEDYNSKLVSKEVVENNFNFDLGPVLVDKVSSDFNNAEFEINGDKDSLIYGKLKSLLADDLVDFQPVKEQILDFCSHVLYTVFLEDQITFDQYRNNEPKRISKLLDVIQNGGLILKDSLTRLLLLRGKLLSLLSLALDETYTHFSVDLYKYLLRLTDLDTFSIEEKGFKKGKKLSDFLEVFDEMLKTCKDTEFKHEGGIPLLKLLNNSNPKIELATNPIKELLLTALGGSVEEGLKLLEEYKFWAIPGEGGQSASAEMLRKYCSETALFLDDVRKISEARHFCFVEDLYSATTAEDPEGKQKVDFQGEFLFKTSYANDSIVNVCRSLKQDKLQNVNPSKITVKGEVREVIYIEDKQLLPPSMTDPFPRFWTKLIGSFYKHGFGDGSKATDYKLEANDLKLLYKEACLPPEKRSKNELINRYEKIPTLKILELMTIKCNQMAGIYIDFLFPKFYTAYGSKPSSPYYIEHVKKIWEIEVKIKSSHEFKVIQKKKFDIFAHSNRGVKIATISYSWTNKPAVMKDASNAAVNINGWEGVLKFTDFEFFDTSYWKDIMLILSRPNDVSSRTNLPLGLEFTTVYKKT